MISRDFEFQKKGRLPGLRTRVLELQVAPELLGPAVAFVFSEKKYRTRHRTGTRDTRHTRS